MDLDLIINSWDESDSDDELVSFSEIREAYEGRIKSFAETLVTGWPEILTRISSRGDPGTLDFEKVYDVHDAYGDPLVISIDEDTELHLDMKVFYVSSNQIIDQIRMTISLDRFYRLERIFENSSSKVFRDHSEARKFLVKVFAANSLMKRGII